MTEQPSNYSSKKGAEVQKQNAPKYALNWSQLKNMPIVLATFVCFAFAVIATLCGSHNHKWWATWTTYAAIVSALFIPFKVYSDSHPDSKLSAKESSNDEAPLSRKREFTPSPSKEEHSPVTAQATQNFIGSIGQQGGNTTQNLFVDTFPPRILTDEQQKLLTSRLRPFAGKTALIVHCGISDKENENFSAQILKCITDAGVEPEQVGYTNGYWGATRLKGVSMGIRDNPPIPLAEALWKALTDIGIKVDVTQNSNNPPNRIFLYILDNPLKK